MLENERFVYPVNKPPKIEQIAKMAMLANDLKNNQTELKSSNKPEPNDFDSLFKAELKKEP